LPAPPTTAPIPNGIARPDRARALRDREALDEVALHGIRDRAKTALGMLWVTSSPQYTERPLPPAACAANCLTRSVPAEPSTMVITSARARSGSVTGMPWISATDCANKRARLEEPDRLDARERDRRSDADGGDDGTRAHRGSARASLAARNRRSRMRMISSGVASGRRLRRPRMCASTIGRCTESTRSIVRCMVGLLFVRSEISLRAMSTTVPAASLEALG
jgi:hypothetical protein